MKSSEADTAVKVSSIAAIFISFQSILSFQGQSIRSELFPLERASCKSKNTRYVVTFKNDAKEREKVSCYITKENLRTHHFHYNKN